MDEIRSRMSTVSGGDNPNSSDQGPPTATGWVRLGATQREVHLLREGERWAALLLVLCLSLLKFMIGDKAENRENVTEGGDG